MSRSFRSTETCCGFITGETELWVIRMWTEKFTLNQNQMNARTRDKDHQ